MIFKSSIFRISAILFLTAIAVITGCRPKDSIDVSPTAALSFSTTLVKFDTVFTSVGSATHNFTARNPGKKSVNISHIMLQGGASSYFRLNIDGRATTDFQNHELAAGDSIFIFAEVTVDPSQANIPFIVSDTVLFVLNGHTQRVALQAFGRNAHFIKHKVLGCDTTWSNDGKPIVMSDTLVVHKGCSLTIQKGTTIYCHRNAVLFVDGTLICNGTKDEPVLFRQDRLEHSYDNEPGQWYGIHILTNSGTNVMTHTILQNGIVGVEVDSLIPNNAAGVKLTMNKCIIKNMSSTGLASFGGTITATNTIVAGSGLYNFYTDLGGTYNFSNCTFDCEQDVVANRQPSVQIGNYIYKNADSMEFVQPVEANFRNCILWGSLEDEIKINKHNHGNTMNLLFFHCVVKAKKTAIAGTNYINKDPLFVHPYGYDYHIDTLSSAINHGESYGPIPVPDDLDDYIRATPNDTIPDIGAYEYHH